MLAFLLVCAGGVFLVGLALDALTGPFSARPVCSAGGERLSPEQTANAAIITAVGLDMGAPERAITIALATALQESSLRNLDHGDRDSLGLFQQRPSQGWGSPEQVQDEVYASRAFFSRLLAVEDYAGMPLTQAAQRVQISAFPGAYAKHETRADAFAAALSGTSAHALSCDLPESAGLDQGRFLAELSRSYPAVTVSGVGAEIHLSGAAGDPWALAHWAIATAEKTGVSQVRYADMVWTRAEGWRAGNGAVDRVAVR